METEVAVRAEDYAHTRKLQWLALSQTPGIGAGRGRKLVEHFGTIDRLFAASLTELEACGMPASSAQFIFDGRARTAAESEVKRVEDLGARFLTQDCAEYPERLLEIYDPDPPAGR